ncbi:MAG TPA: ABC transporter ATP-binding protein [Pseudonocardia sp.]|jgi:putative ABC transport system ATP-binding protein|nr:ABC transporter ATP-binding protein [Pseudonocardia sp.]
MIELEKVTKSFGTGEDEVEILHGIDLRVEAGEMVAIMGPSGSGKSTLMNIIGCLDKPTTGSYSLDGLDVGTMSKSKLARVRGQRIGFVFQSFNLIPRTSAIRNVELPLVYNGISRRGAKAKAALERVGLSGRMHHVPSELSGGQKQRVAIARALINDPSIILADEPTGALDGKTTTEIMTLLTELNDQGCTIVVITHEDEVAEYCSRRVWLRDGDIASNEINHDRRRNDNLVEAGSRVA